MLDGEIRKTRLFRFHDQAELVAANRGHADLFEAKANDTLNPRFRPQLSRRSGMMPRSSWQWRPSRALLCQASIWARRSRCGAYRRIKHPA
jgi:hypothetical protein